MIPAKMELAQIGWNRSTGRPPHVVEPVRSADENQP